MAGWTIHNTAGAVLLATTVAWAAFSIATSLSARPVQIPATTTPHLNVVDVPRTEPTRSDLSSVAPLFGLTVEAASTELAADAPQSAEPPWQNYTPPVLVGVGLLSDRRLAILRLSSGQTRVFTEGQQWEEFTITKVLAGSVHLERSDSIRILSLVGNQ
jgi:hypothetical protein